MAKRMTALSPAQTREIKALAGELSRSFQRAISSRMGKSHNDRRNYAEQFGWKKTPIFDDYMTLYLRHDLAGACIDKPVETSWQQFPEIKEADDKNTPFEESWKELAEQLQLAEAFPWLDKLVCIGKYALLLIGFQDGKNLAEECATATDISYVMPYAECDITIKAYDEDPQSARFCLPTMYTLKVAQVLNGVETQGTPRDVHWSRVLHVVRKPIKGRIQGTPILERSLNNLQNVELVSGSSAEGFWRAAITTLFLKKEAGAGIEDEEATKTAITELVHELKRFLVLEGMEPTQIQGIIEDPANHLAAYIDQIAAGQDIPKRILLGSERGELSSSQDERAWAANIQKRREQYCEPKIIKPFVQRCIDTGVLPAPVADKGKWSCKWSDLLALSPKEQADIGAQKAATLVSVANAISSGIENLVPGEIIQKEYLGMDDDAIALADELLEEANRQEREEEVEPTAPPVNPPANQPVNPNQPNSGANS